MFRPIASGAHTHTYTSLDCAFLIQQTSHSLVCFLVCLPTVFSLLLPCLELCLKWAVESNQRQLQLGGRWVRIKRVVPSRKVWRLVRLNKQEGVCTSFHIATARWFPCISKILQYHSACKQHHFEISDRTCKLYPFWLIKLSSSKAAFGSEVWEQCVPTKLCPLHLQTAGGEGVRPFDGQLKEWRSYSSEVVFCTRRLNLKLLKSENKNHLTRRPIWCPQLKEENGSSLVVTNMGIVPDDEPLVSKPSHRPGPVEVCGVQLVLAERGRCGNKIQPDSSSHSSPSLNVALGGHST